MRFERGHFLLFVIFCTAVWLLFMTISARPFGCGSRQRAPEPYRGLHGENPHRLERYAEDHIEREWIGGTPVGGPPRPYADQVVFRKTWSLLRPRRGYNARQVRVQRRAFAVAYSEGRTPTLSSSGAGTLPRHFTQPDFRPAPASIHRRVSRSVRPVKFRSRRLADVSCEQTMALLWLAPA
jgi:hypothetical protein